MASEVEKIKSTNRILIIALIIASFFLGSLTNQVSSLKKSGASEQVLPAVADPQPQAITKDDMKQWAKDLGLNSSKFDSCLDSEKYKDLIEQDAKDGQLSQVSGTPSFFINGIALVGAQPYDAFKTVIDRELNGTSEATARVTVGTGRLPALGNKDAKITIVEFADLECPFCKRYFTETFSQLKKDYIDTGKVAYYYRHFPLDFHPLARPFAQASECANEQGKFWEMHDKIFQEHS